MNNLFRQALNVKRFQPTFCNFYLSAKFAKIIQFKLADIGEGIAEVQIKDWFINVGDKVKEFDEICTVQSDKATVTITSRYDGVIKKLHYKVDEIAKIGSSLIDIDVENNVDKFGDKNEKVLESDVKKENETVLITKNFNSEASLSKKFLATPAVRRLIRENEIDLNLILGTGKDGRVLKEDILNYMSPNESKTKTEIDIQTPKSNEQDVSVPLKGYTRAMIKSMTEAMKIPHFGFSDECLIDNLMQFRNDLNKYSLENKTKKISYLPIIIKAISIALKEFPILNSSLDDKLNNLIYKNYHNISIAIDTPGGLVVPNIKNCENKTIWEINDELNRLIDLGKKQSFSKEDLANGTFTLSNIGSLGSGTYMNPIIFPPQVAIGAIGAIQKKVYFDAKTNESIEKNIINFSWSADHRVIDGATLCRFNNVIKKFLENPAFMINNLR